MLLSRCTSTTFKDVAQKIGQRLLLYSSAFDADKDGSLAASTSCSTKFTKNSLFSRNNCWNDAINNKNGIQYRKITSMSTFNNSKMHGSSLFNKDKHNSFHQIRTQYEHKDDKTTSLTVWGNLKQIKSSPKPALILGFGGLLPFVAVPTYMLIYQDFSPTLSLAQMGYAACILSFIGGVRWGMTIPENSLIQTDWPNLGYSVVPSLLAWISLLLPGPVDVFILIGGLAMAGYFDMVSWAYPAWFKGLRFTLTFIAVLSLWTTFVCGFLLDSEPDISKLVLSDKNDK